MEIVLEIQESGVNEMRYLHKLIISMYVELHAVQTDANLNSETHECMWKRLVRYLMPLVLCMLWLLKLTSTRFKISTNQWS